MVRIDRERYAAIYGPTGLPLRPRTKMNNRMLLEEDGASGPDHRFSLAELEATALSARASIAEDLLEQVVTRCTGVTTVTVEGIGDVDVSEACSVLAAWDGTASVDSVGAHVWRELVMNSANDDGDAADQGRLYADAFDPENPIYTPTTLAAAGENDTVLDSLARAVATLDQAGIALDARLGDIQYYLLNGQRYPRLGGQYTEGLISIATYGGAPDSKLPFEAAPPRINGKTQLTEEGYQVNGGNSWIMAMEFGEDGPNARAIMVYSQSENPESPHFADQSELYATSTLRDVLFTEAEIAADPNLEVVRLTSED